MTVPLRLIHETPGGLSSTEEIIAEAKAGRMFILADDEDRENEGDLIIPAQFATAEAVNFMARYGRGLICLALEKARAEHLELSLMAADNRSRHQTAFTVSIEAREGITTGISAADRARTIQTAISPKSTAQDIVSPGHIFPLVARDGGVMARAGHTEAAVDIARLAGLIPAGVICEVMNDDGTMARLPELIEFAQFHGLKVGTVGDLIKHRCLNETVVERRMSVPFNSLHGGTFTLHIYVNKLAYAEHVVLVKGDLGASGEPPLVWGHTLNVLEDVLGDLTDSHGGELQMAMKMIAEAGRGVIVLLREGQPTSLSKKLEFQMSGLKAGIRDKREFGTGAQILRDLGIYQLILLSSSRRVFEGLEGYGLRVLEQRPLLTG